MNVDFEIFDLKIVDIFLSLVESFTKNNFEVKQSHDVQ